LGPPLLGPAKGAPPTLLVRPAAGVGLVRGHVDSLLRFANVV
jgi:hypothetical protein